MSPSFGLWNRRSGRSPARALMRSTHPLRSHGLGPWNFGSTAALNTCSVGWYSVEIAAGHAPAGRHYLACSAARRQGTCNSRAGIPRQALEDIVLNALKRHLLSPEYVKE